MQDPATGFEAFWRTEHPRVQRVLTVSFGDADLAAEATDEAFARAYQRWDSVRLMGSPTAWCTTVGRRWAISKIRWRRLRPTVAASKLDRGVTDPDGVLDQRLLAALAALPESQRTAVVARHYLDLTTDQVAELLGVTPSTARSHLKRGLDQLRARLEEAQR